jgi:hypothetical protein
MSEALHTEFAEPVMPVDDDRLQAEVQADNLIDDLKGRLNNKNVEWRDALFETISEWPLPDEVVDGTRQIYLLAGEAFDWRTLANRLMSECRELVDLAEVENLLMGPDPPDGVTDEQFVRMLGFDKHRAHLNYLYGVTIERGLILAVEESIRKRRVSRGYSPSDDRTDDAYVELYRAQLDELLGEFAKETGLSDGRNDWRFQLTETDGFTYWLFKRRFKLAEPARLASDTRKALEQLERMRIADRKRVTALRIYRSQLARDGKKPPRESSSR